MQSHEAKSLLGFAPNSHPSPSQVKAAYKRKAWESHPDRFPGEEKSRAESKFKLISEAYTSLGNGRRVESTTSGMYTRVVRTGVPRARSGKINHPLIGIPFIIIVAGTVGLGGFNASRAYKKEQQNHPSHNPFLP